MRSYPLSWTFVPPQSRFGGLLGYGLTATANLNSDHRVTATTPRMSQTQQARVLIVEDDEDIAVGISRTLDSIGCQSEMASDGDAGVVKAITGAFDLVVVDLLLPKTSGFLLCSKLRAVWRLESGSRAHGQDRRMGRSRSAGQWS